MPGVSWVRSHLFSRRPRKEARPAFEPEPLWVGRLVRASAAMAWMTAVGSALVLAGWAFDLPVLATWVDGQSRPTQPNTALGLLLNGAAVLLLLRPREHRAVAHGVAGLSAIGVALFLAVTALAQYGLGSDWGIDRWLFPGRLDPADPVAGRPASNSAFALTLVAASTLLVASGRQASVWVGQAAAGLAAFFGTLACVGFVYGDLDLRGFPFFRGEMGLATAVMLVLLSTSVILGRPTSGAMLPVVSAGPGGIVLRRMLPVVLLLPALVIAAVEAGAAWGRLARADAFGSMALLATAVLTGGLMATARLLEETELRRSSALETAVRAQEALGQEGQVVTLLRGALIPPSLPRIPGFEVESGYVPSEGIIAGDAFGVTVVRGTLAVVLLDVVGHGAEPALEAVRLKDRFEHGASVGLPPVAILESVASGIEQGRTTMASVVVVELEPSTGAGRYVNAGHPPILHVGASGVERLPGTGPLLGPGLGPWTEGRLELQPGELLVLYTDGLADPQGGDGRSPALSLDELSNVVSRTAEAGARAVVDACLERLRGREPARLRDDAALLVVRRG